MRVLPDLKVTQEELIAMRQRAKKGGSESGILFLKNNHQYYARKIFRNDLGCREKLPIERDRMRENKRQKVVRLYQLEHFPNEVKIIRSVSCEGRFVGYDMTCNPYAKPLYQHSFSIPGFIDSMTEVEKKLEAFHQEGIVYGDVSNANILVDSRKGVVSFCDLDNMQIEEYPSDLVPYELQPFRKDGFYEPGVDAYMLNLVTLSEITGLEYFEILVKLHQGWKPREIEKTGKRTLREMAIAERAHQYSGNYLTKYLKRK